MLKLNEALVVLVRSVIAIITLIIFARMLGKQQVSQLTFFEYVFGITIGSIAASLSVDLTSRAWPHWVGLLTWTLIVWVFQWITVRSKTADEYLVGYPTVVVMNGEIMENAMLKLRYTTSDLLEQLRDKGVFDLSQVAYAVLETDGKLSVLFKPEHQPATRSDLNLAFPAADLSIEIIYNGILQEENLKRIQRDRMWLETQLRSQGINNASEVFLAAFNPGSGVLYIDKFKDMNSPPE